MRLETEPDDVLTETPPPVPTEDQDRKGYELLDGVWVEKAMSEYAGLVGATLSGLLASFIKAKRLGYLYAGEARYRLIPDRLDRFRKPDLSFVARERFPDGRVREGVYTFPPDLAVEVISPTELAEATETKLDEYLRAGVRLVWQVYVPTRNVWAFRPDGTARVYRSGQELPGEDVLPGFAAPVADLFDGV